MTIGAETHRFYSGKTTIDLSLKGEDWAYTVRQHEGPYTRALGARPHSGRLTCSRSAHVAAAEALRRLDWPKKLISVSTIGDILFALSPREAAEQHASLTAPLVPTKPRTPPLEPMAFAELEIELERVARRWLKEGITDKTRESRGHALAVVLEDWLRARLVKVPGLTHGITFGASHAKT